MYWRARARVAEQGSLGGTRMLLDTALYTRFSVPHFARFPPHKPQYYEWESSEPASEPSETGRAAAALPST